MKKVAILGFGTVGVGVADILRDNADVVAKHAGECVELKYVVDLREMPDSPYADKMVKDFEIVVNDPEVGIVVEAIGGVGAALAMVRKALAAGKSVVTSNKQLVAEYGVELFALAREHGGNFLFEASVGGGIPVLNPMTRCLGANHITGVAGILNGTTNFILSQMLEHGETYESALRQAQANGYAEANPAADVEGTDAARKICILSGLAFGKNVRPEDIHVEGITKVTATDAAFAERGGMKIKLLGRTAVKDGKKFCFVSPHIVPGNKVLAAVQIKSTMPVWSCIIIAGALSAGASRFAFSICGRQESYQIVPDCAVHVPPVRSAIDVALAYALSFVVTQTIVA